MKHELLDADRNIKWMTRDEAPGEAAAWLQNLGV